MEQESGYEVEYIFGKNLQDKEQKFFTKWVNFSKQQHTKEPFENLELNNIETILRYERAHFYQLVYEQIYNRECPGKIVRIDEKEMNIIQKKGINNPINSELLILKELNENGKPSLSKERISELKQQEQFDQVQIELDVQTKSRMDNQSYTDNQLSNDQQSQNQMTRQSNTRSSVAKRGRPRKYPLNEQSLDIKGNQSDDGIIDFLKKTRNGQKRLAEKSLQKNLKKSEKKQSEIKNEEFQEIEAQKLLVVIDNNNGNTLQHGDGDISIPLKNSNQQFHELPYKIKKNHRGKKIHIIPSVEVTNREQHNSYYRTYDNNEDNELEIFKIPFGKPDYILKLIGCSFDYIHQQLENQALLHMIEQKVDITNEYGNFVSDTPKQISYHALGIDQTSNDGKLKLFFKVDFDERQYGISPKSIWITKDQAIRHIKDLFLHYTLQNTIWLPTFAKD